MKSTPAMDKHVILVNITSQSAYRPGHSTEAALLKVVYDMFLSLSKGNISVHALLDFSSAFDTIDHYPCTPSPY